MKEKFTLQECPKCHALYSSKALTCPTCNSVEQSEIQEQSLEECAGDLIKRLESHKGDNENLEFILDLLKASD